MGCFDVFIILFVFGCAWYDLNLSLIRLEKKFDLFIGTDNQELIEKGGRGE